MIVRRRIVKDGKPVAFSCQTRQFRTDLSRGMAHGSYAPTLGSATDTPLVDRYGYTLWLEHVAPTATHRGGFWLVWYDPLGVPAAMTNGILDRNDVVQMGNVLRSAV